MNISKKVYASSILIVAVASIMFGYAVQQFTFNKAHKPMQIGVNVWVFKETFNGTEVLVAGNVLTDGFENYVANIVGFNNVSALNSTKYIALGNSSIAQTKTKLDTEATTSGFGRATATTITKQTLGGDIYCNYTKKFTATGTIYINAAALHYDPTANTANNIVALASLGGTEKFENLWNCTITWSIQYNAN